MELDINAFAHGAGFSEGSGVPQTIEAIQELNKALSAGQITGGASVNSSIAGQGAALKPESLDRQLKLLTFRDSDIRLWRLFPRSAAYNTVEEFIQLESYGVERGGAYNEGELALEEDSTYVRRAEKIKYYGVTKSITHPMQLVNSSIGSIMQREITNGTMYLLRKINRALAFGDENIVPQEINGVYKQHQLGISSTLSTYQASEQVIDLKGAALTQDKVQDAGTIIFASGFGTPTHLFGTAETLNDFAKDYYTNQRIFLNQNQGDITGGLVIGHPKKLTLSFGDVGLEHDIFLKSQTPVEGTAAANTTNAPQSVTAGAVPVVASDAALTKFVTADAGDYKYAVAALNRFGRSAITVLDATPVTVAAGESVDLTFTDGGGANPATGYQIYRTVKGAVSGTTTFYPIFQVSKAELTSGFNGGAAGKVRDRNYRIANTEEAFLADVPNTFEIKQLAPLMKLDLAVLAPATRFMILAYLTMFLVAPLKVVKFTNVGRVIAS